MAVEVAHARFPDGTSFGGDVHGTVRIVADEDGREAGDSPAPVAAATSAATCARIRRAILVPSIMVVMVANRLLVVRNDSPG
ncbi:hypothetical protein ACGFY7_40170 [Streptomyces prunicolor]|uniref:hypothetical protein n=1 Tax=Streptomyces prunicolor TaxID=67348 RepID=UPI003721BE07